MQDPKISNRDDENNNKNDENCAKIGGKKCNSKKSKQVTNE